MKKKLEGKVISVKMQNTVVVEVTRRSPHPMYKKLITRSKKYKADISGNIVGVGDRVTISEIKPMSKDKHFKIEKILRKEADR